MDRQEREKQQALEYYESLSFEREFIDPGSVTYFNIHYGYLEALLRGFRSGILTANHYRSLCQCAKLEEFKVCLVDTDYNGVLDDANSGEFKLTTNIIVQECYKKFVDEFMHIRTQSTGALKTFLDMIRYEYMIENIVLLLRGMINDNPPDEILPKINPLGVFPNLRSVMAGFDKNDSEGGLVKLFETVLIDTPVGHLFERYFVEQDDSKAGDDTELKGMLMPNKIDIVATQVKRLWLQDFYQFCSKLGGETAQQMCELLEFEADKRAVRIMVNSFGSELNEGHERDLRQKLFAGFGTLYPEGINDFRKVSDLQDLGTVLQKFPTFKDIYEEAARGEKDIEDCLLQEEVRLNEFAFWGQNHFAAFWGFVRLKEQEMRNLYWIADCITAKRRDPASMNKWIPILSYEG